MYWERVGHSGGHGTVGAVVFDGNGNLAAGIVVSSGLSRVLLLELK